MVALLAASQLIDFGVFALRFKAFNADYHRSVFGVVSLAAEVVAAAASGWRANHEDHRRWAWAALSAVMTGLVLVRVLATFHAATVAAPLACMLWLLGWLTWRDAPAARMVVWAAVAFMGISLLLHEVGLDADVLNYSSQSWAYQITCIVKHGCELGGWMLLATGITAGLERR